MIIAYFVVLGSMFIVGLAFATWVYFDPDRDWRYDEKHQRVLVRFWLLFAFSAFVWPIALAGSVVVGLVKLFAFAFPRGTVDE